MTDMLVICNICAICKRCKICAICKIFNLAAPPARSLYTTMGPDGRYASASRIVANNVVVFPPDRRIKAAKSNGVGAVAFAGWAAQFEAACHLVHFHHLQDLQNAMDARLRRLKVHILAPATELDA